jgi:hypothetical protein
MPPAERRTAPRLEVLSQFHGHLVPFGVPLRVRDVSAGGFSIESSVPFPVGARHEFRFTTASGQEVRIAATVMHTQPAGADAESPTYICGLAFLHDPNHDTGGDIDTLLEAMSETPQSEAVLH